MSDKTLAAPGLDAVRAAYDEIAAHTGADPVYIADWLHEHVGTVAAEHLADTPSLLLPALAHEVELSDDDRKAIRSYLLVAVDVYDRRRKRLDLTDTFASATAAASINRAAVIRQMRGTDTKRTRVVTVEVDVVLAGEGKRSGTKTYPTTGATIYVSAVLRSGDTYRAASLVVTRTTYNVHRLMDFNILH